MGVKERREREEKVRLSSILVAAEKVFAKKGYYHSRMDDIAEAAELAKGTLYYYFKSKDEIYLLLMAREVQHVHKEIQNRISKATSFHEVLEQAIEFYLEYFEKNRSFLRMFLPCMCELIHFEDKKALQKATKSYKHHGEFIRETLKKKIKSENLHISLDELMKFLKTLQIGIGIKLLEGDKTEAKAAARFFLDLIKRIMEDKR